MLISFLTIASNVGADLRAFCVSAEGLYHLEGLMRFTGISEGFTAKIA